MAQEDKTSEVWQAVGRYFCAFSEVEHELGEALKIIFKLDRVENADVIVACLADITKKLNVVWSGAKQARMADGSDPRAAWKESSEKIMKRILGINQGDRALLAHSLLRPQPEGTLRLTRMTSQGVLKITPHEWSLEELANKCAELNQLAEAVRKIRQELSTFTFKIDVPPELVLFVADTEPSAGTAPIFGGSGAS